jgi:metal-sulfur cluster biosynthetic enzyme
MAANPNPTVYATAEYVRHVADNLESSSREPIDPLEIYEHLRFILDPEHPLTLEQLHIVSPGDICVDDAGGSVEVVFTPTVPNCSWTAVLGLCIREKLIRVLPLRFHSKLRIKVALGTHIEEDAVNRQLRDKERCLAAVERRNIRDMIGQCIANQGS